MIERIATPPEPRLAPLAKLREVVTPPQEDREARKLLRRLEIKEALK